MHENHYVVAAACRILAKLGSEKCLPALKGIAIGGLTLSIGASSQAVSNYSSRMSITSRT